MHPQKFLQTVRLEDIILFEDEHIIVINKPLHMASLDDKEHRSLKDLAHDYLPGLHLCHRLDKMTSGTLIMAKNMEAYRHIAIQFQEREIHKNYHTFVSGVHDFNDYEIDLPIFVSSNKKVSIDAYNGKVAQTIVTTLKAFRGYTMLQCEPVSGRMHQIRIHLAAMSCPIIGDKLYGGKDMFLSDLKRKYKASTTDEHEQSLNRELLLHARNITFKHPATDEYVSFEAEYPKHFRVVLTALQKYAG